MVRGMAEWRHEAHRVPLEVVRERSGSSPQAAALSVGGRVAKPSVLPSGYSPQVAALSVGCSVAMP